MDISERAQRIRAGLPRGSVVDLFCCVGAAVAALGSLLALILGVSRRRLFLLIVGAYSLDARLARAQSAVLAGATTRD